MSSDLFNEKMNAIINHFRTLQKVFRSLAKLRTKPLITKGILKSMKLETKYIGKWCRAKNVIKMRELTLTFNI